MSTHSVTTSDKRGQTAIVVMAIVGVLATVGSFEVGRAFTRAADRIPAAGQSANSTPLLARNEVAITSAGYCGEP